MVNMYSMPILLPVNVQNMFGVVVKINQSHYAGFQRHENYLIVTGDFV